MTTLADALRDPIALAPNRPPRFYRGGRLLEAFRGRPDADDDDRPEDWVGSATRTWTPPGVPASEAGPSDVEVGERRLRLDEALAAEPEAMVGAAWLAVAGPTLGLLVKLLDAAVRLPVHAHPTREAARRLLGSPFGKTEAWIILGTRDGGAPARVWAGFREPAARGALRRWIEAQDTGAMLGALAEHTVEPGAALLVPGGTPHAIGAGVFLLELQEPTDFSVVAETRGFPIVPTDATLGLGWDVALDFFDTAAPAPVPQAPERMGEGIERLLGPAADPYFRALRLRVDGSREWPLPPAFTAGVVLAGCGAISGPRMRLPLHRGATFALPAAAAAEARLGGDGLELVACLPPDPEALGHGFRGP
jgi:mannose-6-phosphate isomerase